MHVSHDSKPIEHIPMVHIYAQHNLSGTVVLFTMNTLQPKFPTGIEKIFYFREGSQISHISLLVSIYAEIAMFPSNCRISQPDTKIPYKSSFFIPRLPTNRHVQSNHLSVE